ncbi:hypothetical protein B0J14DRAFT_598868 [Halenospora varia]|nr:hypothetical protein B0J14DRAFT_598868 [Halenospora varia]
MSSPPRKSFLDLPQSIRRTIYHEAGLAHGWRINLSTSTCISMDIGDQHRFNNGSIIIPHFTLSGQHKTMMSLLLVSRTISDEVSHLLYSENVFFLSRNKGDGLQPGLYLSKKAVAAMRFLEIDINLCNWAEDGSCSRPQWSYVIPKYHHPLSYSNPRDTVIIAEWQTIANRIAKFIARDLSLQVICEVADYETAEKVVKPLLSMAPLKDVHLRLSKKPDRKLRTLAQQTRQRAMGGTVKSPTFFRYNDLPKELRRLILEYTSLVSPMEIHWHPIRNFHQPEKRVKICGSTHDTCFCSLEHGAASSKCHCYDPPFSIFHVSRRMRLEAQEVFYSTNNFVVEPMNGFHELLDETPNEVEILLFLLRMPQDALCHLRSVEIVFPPCCQDQFHPELHEHGFNSWLKAIDILAKETVLSSLTLRISFFQAEHGQGHVGRQAYMHSEFDSIFEICRRMIKPVAKLKGLKDLFIHRGSVVRHVEDSIFREQQEMALEEIVMGSGYDSVLRGKSEGLGRWDWEMSHPVLVAERAAQHVRY